MNKIDSIVFPIAVDEFVEALAVETILNVYNSILRCCGQPPRLLTVPEGLWVSLYRECMVNSKYLKLPGHSSFYKIMITTPHGEVEVRPE